MSHFEIPLMPIVKNIRVACATGLLYLVISLQAFADEKSDAIELVDSAEATFQNFVSDPDMGWFRDNVADAKALVIVPQLFKAGFIFGASGGNGIVMAKDKASESWSNPAFYSVGSVTWGLQIGGEVAEVVMLVMTESGMHALLSTKLQLGADVSVAAGPVGAGAQAATVDILQFTRAKGIFGGLTLEGAVITPRDDLADAFYGRIVDPLDILVRQRVTNKNADRLRGLVFRTTSNKQQ
jgi:lipid-binding SYLF domain-containing protein